MKTEILKAATAQEIEYAAMIGGKIINEGGIVAMPTETVYGLAASIDNDDAINSIFKVKGRPQDNPIIVHIAEREDIYSLVSSIPDEAKALMDAFWPGPLTIILKKSEQISDVVTSNLDTVGIRMPSHPAARALIKAAGCPLAAPSANLSGKPSTTSAKHVFDDLSGKIPLIIDGGQSTVGLESTVLTVLDGGTALILRPGSITPEMIEGVGVKVKIDSAVERPLNEGEKPISPGTAHKHYSPKAKVILLKGTRNKIFEFAKNYADKNAAVICFLKQKLPRGVKRIDIGENEEDKARLIFDALRKADEMELDEVLVSVEENSGIGLAINNRLLRAAEFKVIDVE